MKNFLWEIINEGRRFHLVNCEVVSMFVELGDLGIGNLRLHNEALLMR